MGEIWTGRIPLTEPLGAEESRISDRAEAVEIHVRSAYVQGLQWSVCIQ